MSLSVNVQVDSNGVRTVSIDGLKSTDTIANLVQKLVDQEGLDQDTMGTLIFRGKPLSDTSKQLKDVGIRARSLLNVTFRVRLGGVRYDQDIDHYIKLQHTSLSKEEESKLSQMKEKYGFNDEKMNLFKLKLYNWNINDARKYYKYDEFCLDYCIRKNFQYGCNKQSCPYKHSINLFDFVYGNIQQRDYKQGELLCLYLMYKNIYNDSNPELFCKYAWILHATGKSQEDYKKSERYYLKALAIDNNYSIAHNMYAGLLSNYLNNYDKTEYHYNKSLTTDPKNGICHSNFASFLTRIQHKYELALSHSEKACKLSPNLSYAHYCKAESLYKLNKFDLSLKEYSKCLQLKENDGLLWPYQVENAKKQITNLTKKLSQNWMWWWSYGDEKKGDAPV